MIKASLEDKRRYEWMMYDCLQLTSHDKLVCRLKQELAVGNVAIACQVKEICENLVFPQKAMLAIKDGSADNGMLAIKDDAAVDSDSDGTMSQDSLTM